MKRKATTRKKKPTLAQTAKRLAAIAQKHLSTLAPEKREERMLSLERSTYLATSRIRFMVIS
jgi:hypothetical protein